MSTYEIVVYIHILSAMIWVGGILFLGAVAGPVGRSLDDDWGVYVTSCLGRRFRTVGWAALGLLVVTGVIQMQYHGATVANVLDGSFFAAGWGRTMGHKLIAVAVMMAVSAVHDFYYGPRTEAAYERTQGEGPSFERQRRVSAWLGRLTGLLALVVVALAVMLVR